MCACVCVEQAQKGVRQQKEKKKLERGQLICCQLLDAADDT